MTDSEKGKIAQKVNYLLELDIYNLCSEDICRKLEGKAEKLGFNPSETSGVSDKDIKCKAELLLTESRETSRGTFKEGSPTNKEQLTGFYDLVVILTHKGRSANSGHYIAYVKEESGQWIQFDDHTVKPQHPEDITDLCGGDLKRDIAYILLYKARITSV